MTVYIPVHKCGECFFQKHVKVYTPDSFEDVYDIMCLKANRKVTQIETVFDKLPTKIPRWCPLR